MNRHLKYLLISIAVTLIVNCIFISEAILAYRRTEYLEIGGFLAALSKPPEILAGLFLPEGGHSMSQAVAFFAASILFYFCATFIILEVWRWILDGRRHANNSISKSG
jgi:hypothetical protein